MTNQEFKLKKAALAIKALFGITMLVATLLFGSAALIHTTNPAQADAPTVTNDAGRYQMQFQSVYGTKIHWYVLVWDTSTGRSKMYFGDDKSQSGLKAAPANYSPPSSPL